MSIISDVLAMTLYAILSALALAAVFFGLAHQPLSQTYISDIAGTSPVALFLVVCVPLLLAFCVSHQDCAFVKTHEVEIPKCRLAERTMINEQDLPKPSLQKVQAIRDSFKCPLCTRAFWKPYILAPCGHTFDFDCLRRHFHTAPPTDIDRRFGRVDRRFGRIDLTARQKLCPTCRTEVAVPPAPIWVVKAIADTVAHPSLASGAYGETARLWEGIFDIDVPRPKTKIRRAFRPPPPRAQPPVPRVRPAAPPRPQPAAPRAVAAAALRPLLLNPQDPRLRPQRVPIPRVAPALRPLILNPNPQDLHPPAVPQAPLPRALLPPPPRHAHRVIDLRGVADDDEFYARLRAALGPARPGVERMELVIPEVD